MRPAYRPAWIHRVTTVIVLAVLWHVSWRLAEFGGVTGHASLWYPPAGLTLALALVLRARAGLLVVATVALGSMLSGGWQAIASDAWPWPEALAITAGLGVAHAAPALLGAAVIRRASGASWRLGTFNGTLAFLATVPVVAALAAAGGLLIIVAIGDLEPASALDIFVPWLIGDMIGAYTLAPALAMLLARPLGRGLGTAVTPRLRKRPAETFRTLPFLALLLLGGSVAALPGLQPERLDGPGLFVLVMSVASLVVLLIALTQPPAATVFAVGLVGTTPLVFGVPPERPALGADIQLWVVGTVLLAHLGSVVQDLHRRATEDPLTGLANRRRLLDVAARRHRRRHPMAMLLIDLDHFKAVNDRFGHPTGDRVLRSTARALHLACPPGSLTARMGGEEFAVLVQGGKDEAHGLAEALLWTLRRSPIDLEGTPLVVRASIGIAVGDAACPPKRLLERADAALYAAKRAGRDRVVLWHPAMEGATAKGIPLAAVADRPD